jgi:hypothetical protein
LDNDSTESPDFAKRKKTVYVTISKEDFDSIPHKRAGYMMACGGIHLIKIGDMIYEYLRGPLPDFALYAVVAAYFVAYALMYIYLISAMRTMQLSWLSVLPACVIVFFPFVGLMPLALIDRYIAKNWDSAQEKQDQYRQRIIEEESNQSTDD